MLPIPLHFLAQVARAGRGVAFPPLVPTSCANSNFAALTNFNICTVYGSRYIQLPLIEKLIQWLSGPSPSLSATTDRLAVTRPDSNDVRTRSIYSTISVDDINAKAVEA
jgi:hypothetical protein